MTLPFSGTRPVLEVADVIRQHGAAFIQQTEQQMFRADVLILEFGRFGGGGIESFFQRRA